MGQGKGSFRVSGCDAHPGNHSFTWGACLDNPSEVTPSLSKALFLLQMPALSSLVGPEPPPGRAPQAERGPHQGPLRGET